MSANYTTAMRWSYSGNVSDAKDEDEVNHTRHIEGARDGDVEDLPVSEKFEGPRGRSPTVQVFAVDPADDENHYNPCSYPLDTEKAL